MLRAERRKPIQACWPATADQRRASGLPVSVVGWPEPGKISPDQSVSRVFGRLNGGAVLRFFVGGPCYGIVRRFLSMVALLLRGHDHVFLVRSTRRAVTQGGKYRRRSKALLTRFNLDGTQSEQYAPRISGCSGSSEGNLAGCSRGNRPTFEVSRSDGGPVDRAIAAGLRHAQATAVVWRRWSALAQRRRGGDQTAIDFGVDARRAGADQRADVRHRAGAGAVLRAVARLAAGRRMGSPAA